MQSHFTVQPSYLPSGLMDYVFLHDSTGDRTIGFLLFSAFKSRYKEVLTKAHTAGNVASPKILSRLTKEEVNCEKHFYVLAHSFLASILLDSQLSFSTLQCMRLHSRQWQPSSSGVKAVRGFSLRQFSGWRENQPTKRDHPMTEIWHHLSIGKLLTLAL